MNEALYQALIARLKTVSGLPKLQVENTVAKANGEFTRATLIRTRPQQLSVGVNGRDLHVGLMQVDIFVPVNTGTSQANTIADSVIAAFPRGLTLNAGDNRVHIRTAYRETASRLNDQFHQVPVVVEWQLVL